MKKRTLQISIYLLILGSTIQAASQQIAITASDYCEFLNVAAATDPQGLYDEKMETDLTGACVTRTSAPGNFSYQVAVGKSEVPITFLSFENATLYCNWLSNKDSSSTSTFNFNCCAGTTDQQLKSSQITFQLINTSTPNGPAQQSSGGGDKDTSWEEKVVEAAAGIGMILGGGGADAARESAGGEDQIVTERTAVSPAENAIQNRPTYLFTSFSNLIRQSSTRFALALRAASEHLLPGFPAIGRFIHQLCTATLRIVNPGALANADEEQATNIHNRAHQLRNEAEQTPNGRTFTETAIAGKVVSAAWNQALETKTVLQKSKEADALAELNALKVAANTDWQKAFDIHNRAQQLKNETERTQAEGAFAELADRNKAAATAWAAAIETKKALLSKATEADKPALIADIKTAEERKKEHDASAVTALQKAREADAALIKNLQIQIRQAQERVDTLQAEVNRVHDSWLYALRTTAKQETIDNLVQAETALIKLEAERGRLERKAIWSRLTPEQQRENERKALEFENRDKQQRLAWARLTPQEKQEQKWDHDNKLVTRSLKAYEEKDVARSRNNQLTCRVYEKISGILIRLKEADYENRESTEVKKGATYWRERVLAYEQQVATLEQQLAALARGDHAAAEVYNKIDYSAVAYDYQRAAEAQATGKPQAAELYLKSAKADEERAAALTQQVAALARGDQAAAEFYKKITEIHKYYIHGGPYAQAAEAQAKGNPQAAEAYHKAAQASEEKVAALIRSDSMSAEMYYNIELAQFHAAHSYTWAVKEAKSDSEMAGYHKKAQAHEAQAAALARGDLASAEMHEKRGIAYEQAVYAARSARLEGSRNHQVAGAFHKEAQAYEDQAAALLRGNQVAAAIHEKTAKAQRILSNIYTKSATKRNPQITELYSKSVQAYEQQIAALSRKDQIAAEIYETSATAQEWAGTYYEWALDEQTRGNLQVAEAYRKGAQAYEKQTAALARRDTTTAELHKKSADTYYKVASAYKTAAEQQARGNSQAAEVWRKSAQFYEFQAVAFDRGDQAAAEMYKQLADAQCNAAVAYGTVKETPREELAEARRKQAQAYEAQAAALLRRDLAAAEIHQKAAKAQENAATIYKEVFNAEYEGGNEFLSRVEAWRKQAQAYEARAEALARGDTAAAEEYKQVAEGKKK